MPTYDLAEWTALREQIKAGGQMVSGMTPAEAQAALKTQTITTQGGSSLHIYNPGSTPSPQPPLQFPGTDTPVDAYWEYVNQGGATNAGGAATSGSSVINNSNATITKTATGATGIAGVLSMNLPTAAAAIAPVAGFALGAGLYYSNPDLWDTISRTLLPFCYESTQLLPVVVDENGVTYYSKEMIDALKKVLGDSVTVVAGSDTTGIDKNLSPYPFNFIANTTQFYVSGYYNGVFCSQMYSFSDPVNITTIKDRNYYNIIISSKARFTCKEEYSTGPKSIITMPSSGSADLESNYNGLVSWSDDGDFINYNAFTDISIPIYSEWVASPGMNRGTFASVGWEMVYGSVAKYPDGISKWDGATYPSTPQPIEVFTRYNDVGEAEFLPFYPITTPVGDPGVTASPLEVPNPPTTNPNPAPAINPWITPNPSPNTYPGGVPQSNPAQLPGNVPDYTPNLNPESDPSQEPVPEPAPEPDPAPNENSSGSSPIPIIPEFPALPSAASSLLHVYNPTQSQIDSFGSWLWTTFSGDLIDTVSKLFNDPMDAVIGLHELYATPATSGSSTIRAGFLDSGVSSKLVGSRYTSINCGSVVVPEYYQNYLDYSPYTKCFVYLPFVGIVPVSADDIIGNAVQIKYNVDSYTGCCIAIITVAREGYSSTVYQFEGNCGVEIPITSGYQSTLIGGLLGVAGTAISGSPHVGLAAASLGRANLGKNEVSHSGSFGSSYGAMGAKIPYIIVKRPTQKNVVNYNEEYGFPSHKRVRIGDCSGYLRAREVHVVSPTATDEEKARIEEMLKEGVFVK